MADQTALARLMAEPKGKTTYSPSSAFLLHVFWECPSATSAQTLLSALSQCATATHRDTPCVPVYFFRLSPINNDLCSPPPRTLAEHPGLAAAFRKLRIGVPRGAVAADLVRRGIDPGLLDADPDDELPEALRESPVAVECTELYLDERAFNEHAGSADYLAAYGKVMDPSLQNSTTTVRIGRPSEFLVDRILAPMLKERVREVGRGVWVWRRPEGRGREILVSLDLDVEDEEVGDVLDKLLKESERYYAMRVVFRHPLREGTARFLAVLSGPLEEMLKGFEALPVQRGEVHCTDADKGEILAILEKCGLQEKVCVRTTDSVGYILHKKAQELEEIVQ